jgi:hypothetical protein
MKLRMFTAYWDGENAKLKFSEIFDDHQPILRADFLQDVLVELEERYEKAREEL